MTAKTKFKSDAFEAIHASAQALQKIGAIDKATMYLNTTESTVQKWETGANRPSGMALKLLNIVQKHGLKVLA